MKKLPGEHHSSVAGADIEADVETLIDDPLIGLSPPYQFEDYFELLVRSDRLNSELERVQAAQFNAEEVRTQTLKKIKGALQTIKRHTYPENLDKASSYRGKPQIGMMQRQLIIMALQDEGLDPKKLIIRPGKVSPKKAVRVRMRKEYPNYFRSDNAFDAAWKRLRAYGDIATDPDQA
jgi:hypothetical protein